MDLCTGIESIALLGQGRAEEVHHTSEAIETGDGTQVPWIEAFETRSDGDRIENRRRPGGQGL